MQDNFDLYEYKNTLREQSLSGVDASTKVLEFLRSKIYPKLNDDEMDTFVVEMANHFDMTPPSYRLKEDSQQTISLDDLTFDILVQSFGEKPMFGFNVPNANDSSNSIHDQDGLDRWSNSIRNKYGNVNIRIDRESSANVVEIINRYNIISATTTTNNNLTTRSPSRLFSSTQHATDYTYIPKRARQHIQTQLDNTFNTYGYLRFT